MAGAGDAWLPLGAYDSKGRETVMARRDPGLSRLLTVAEIASVMRVSRMTVYRLIRRGQLKAIRVGRNYRVREDDLNLYLEAQAVSGEILA